MISMVRSRPTWWTWRGGCSQPVTHIVSSVAASGLKASARRTLAASINFMDVYPPAARIGGFGSGPDETRGSRHKFARVVRRHVAAGQRGRGQGLDRAALAHHHQPLAQV